MLAGVGVVILLGVWWANSADHAATLRNLYAFVVVITALSYHSGNFYSNMKKLYSDACQVFPGADGSLCVRVFWGFGWRAHFRLLTECNHNHQVLQDSPKR